MIRSMVENAKYKKNPSREVVGGASRDRRRRRTSAAKVDGYGSDLYLRGKRGSIKLAAGRSNMAIKKTRMNLSIGSLRIEIRIERDCLINAMKIKSSIMAASSERAIVNGRTSIVVNIQSVRKSGIRNIEKTVRSESIVAAMKALGVIVEVKKRDSS